MNFRLERMAQICHQIQHHNTNCVYFTKLIFHRTRLFLSLSLAKSKLNVHIRAVLCFRGFNDQKLLTSWQKNQKNLQYTIEWVEETKLRKSERELNIVRIIFPFCGNGWVLRYMLLVDEVHIDESHNSFKNCRPKANDIWNYWAITWYEKLIYSGNCQIYCQRKKKRII